MPIQNLTTEYCMYLRKSRLDMEAEARGEGDTLARHRRTLLALGRSMGITIGRIYEEVVSGETIAARPEVQNLLRDVESGHWKGCLCMEVERLARGNTTDQGLVADTFKYSSTLIVTPSKIYDPSDEFDEEFFEFGLFRSRMEYRTINRRLQRGREASLREGKYIAGSAPYGYERYKLPREKGYSLRVIPEKAEVVKQIFQWFVHGELSPDGGPSSPLGSLSIAKKLDMLGIPSPGGGKWSACSVRDIISNPTYIGKVRWSYRPTVKQMVNGQRIETRPQNNDVPLYDGIHEPIIDPDLWHQAQAIMKGRAHPPVHKSSFIQNPLVGIVFCSKCGHSMLRLPSSHGRVALRCPNKDCDCVSSPLEDVETALLSALGGWLSDYKIKQAQLPPSEQDATESAQREVSRLEQSLATLRRQLDSLYDLVETGAYTQELFLQRSQVLSGRLKETQSALDAANARLSSGKKIQQSRVEIIPKVEYVLKAYSKLESPAEKNALLKTVLDKVIYSKAQGGRYVESDMQLFLFPRLETPTP